MYWRVLIIIIFGICSICYGDNITTNTSIIEKNISLKIGDSYNFRYHGDVYTVKVNNILVDSNNNYLVETLLIKNKNVINSINKIVPYWFYYNGINVSLNSVMVTSSKEAYVHLTLKYNTTNTTSNTTNITNVTRTNITLKPKLIITQDNYNVSGEVATIFIPIKNIGNSTAKSVVIEIVDSGVFENKKRSDTIGSIAPNQVKYGNLSISCKGVSSNSNKIKVRIKYCGEGGNYSYNKTLYINVNTNTKELQDLYEKIEYYRRLINEIEKYDYWNSFDSDYLMGLLYNAEIECDANNIDEAESKINAFEDILSNELNKLLDTIRNKIKDYNINNSKLESYLLLLRNYTKTKNFKGISLTLSQIDTEINVLLMNRYTSLKKDAENLNLNLDNELNSIYTDILNDKYDSAYKKLVALNNTITKIKRMNKKIEMQENELQLYKKYKINDTSYYENIKDIEKNIEKAKDYLKNKNTDDAQKLIEENDKILNSLHDSLSKYREMVIHKRDIAISQLKEAKQLECDTSKINEIIYEGDRLYNNGDYVSAKKKYDEAIANLNELINKAKMKFYGILALVGMLVIAISGMIFVRIRKKSNDDEEDDGLSYLFDDEDID